MVSGAYPQVQAFIKSDRPERYKGLTIKYVRGADPVIKLLDDEEDVSNKKISSRNPSRLGSHHSWLAYARK